MHSSAVSDEVEIQGKIFSITHLRFRASSMKSHTLSFCAANRLVKEESLNGKIPGLIGKICDENGDFVYSCYVSSPFLDERVRSERTGFDLEETVDGLFGETEISLKVIRAAIFPKIKESLSNCLEANIQAGKKRVDDFIRDTAPRYRPILSKIPEADLVIDAAISDKDLDLLLHKHLAELERQVISDGHSIMVLNQGESHDDYHARVHAYLKNVTDIKKSDLADYLCHRRVIIDLLEKAIQQRDDGKYCTEDIVHQLIMPMRYESNEISWGSCNLWLVDERLAFHDYLASDKTLKSMPITDSIETKEPDLLALNVYDNPLLVADNQSLPLASIVVVEIKRPMRNDARSGEDKDPIEQALGYLNRIRKGQVKTQSGRLIPNSESIPGYCYIVCDLTDSVKARCEFLDLTVTSDHMGYFGFHKIYKAYIEVISFDKLVHSAKQRNRAFFDKLGLPSN